MLTSWLVCGKRKVSLSAINLVGCFGWNRIGTDAPAPRRLSRAISPIASLKELLLRVLLAEVEWPVLVGAGSTAGDMGCTSPRRGSALSALALAPLMVEAYRAALCDGSHGAGALRAQRAVVPALPVELPPGARLDPLGYHALTEDGSTLGERSPRACWQACWRARRGGALTAATRLS